MVRHIIFDCFGTLINTGDGSIKAVEQILSNVCSHEDTKEFYAYWKKVKKQMTDNSDFINEKTLFKLSLEETFVHYGICANASEEVKPMIQSLFAERLVFEDVKNVLNQLAEKGVDFAIGSNTDTDSLMYYLKSNNLMFSHIYTSENMEVYKPNPKFYETILDRSGWSVDDCIFVGDSYIDDVYGPKTIGMRAVLLDRRRMYHDMDLNPVPDYIIHSLDELINIL
ncbi:MAG: HAD family hydrolase [Lachnospiraceae bacterium]|nr:HAD family hydrolase [Lachnospiraceae bacterium]MDE6698381.1 HAD family hydrolase [Lachnospiraceae bacterium]